MTSAAAKARVREHVRAGRRHGPSADPHALAARALEFLDGVTGPLRVTCYSSYGTEPGTSALLAALRERGYEVLLPRVVGDDLAWVPQGPTSHMSSMGIAEPTGEAVDLLPVRALLVPALAVSADGSRLGKGGGYYDRVLAGLPPHDRPAIAAIVRDEDVLPDGEIPRDDHDMLVDAIITPTRVAYCATR